MYYSIKTQPIDVLITLAEAKIYLKMDEITDDDALITDIIQSVISFASKFTNITFGLTTFEGYFENFCYSDRFGYHIELTKSPFSEIVSVNINGSVFTDYVLNKTDYYNYVVPNAYESLNDDIYPIVIEFKAGYSVLPYDLKNAMLSHINFLYTNRGEVNSKVPDNILQVYLNNNIGGSYAI